MTSGGAHLDLTSIMMTSLDVSTLSTFFGNTTGFIDILDNTSSEFAYNSTGVDQDASDPEVPEAFMGVYFAIRILMSILAIGGNGLTIVVIIKYETLHTTTNVLIANLAVADMLTGLLMPVVITHHILRQHPIFVPLCLVEKVFSSISLRANLLFILWIAIDRYFYIAYPLKYVLWMTPKRTFAVIFTTWTYIAVDSSVIMAVANVLKPGGTCKLGAIINAKVFQLYYLPQLYISIPITIACYIAIAKITIKQSRAIAALNQPFDTIEASINRRQRRTAMMMFTVLASHLLSWLPQVALTVVIQNNKTTRTLVMELVTTAIFYTNSFLNPMIYAWKSKELKVAFRKLLGLPNEVTPYINM